MLRDLITLPRKMRFPVTKGVECESPTVPSRESSPRYLFLLYLLFLLHLLYLLYLLYLLCVLYLLCLLYLRLRSHHSKQLEWRPRDAPHSEDGTKAAAPCPRWRGIATVGGCT